MIDHDKPEPECVNAYLDDKPMHQAVRNPATGECLFCMALRSAYQRGVESALNGKEGF